MLKKRGIVFNLAQNYNKKFVMRFFTQNNISNNITNRNISLLCINLQNQPEIFQLRGGGCGLSNFCRSGQLPEHQEMILTNENNVQNLDQKNIQSEKLPNNFLKEFDQSVIVIQEGSISLVSQSKKNEVIIKIQWFIYNKQFFNKLCQEENTYELIKTDIDTNLLKLLEILPNYLEVSWFLCYQIAQVCNDLLRIIYSHNTIKFDPMPFLQKVSIFSEQLQSQSNNVWKSGLEFEITLMEIMLENCSNPEQEKKLLIDVAKNTVKSILKMKITDALMSSLKKSAKYIIKKAINSKILYPIEVYQIYHLFQIIKWKIIEDETESVYQSIQNLKNLFNKYIKGSNNWILHFCWIQTITDIILYRLIIEKESQQILQEVQKNVGTIQKLPFNHNQAILLFFDTQPNILEDSILNQYNKLQLLCSSLIEQQFAKEQNFWDYYSNFHFNISEQEDSKQFNFIQVNRELGLLEKLFKQLRALIDQIQVIQLEIEESLINQVSVEKTLLSQQLFEEHKKKILNKFLNTWKKAIYLINLINDFLLFDYQKVQLFQNNLKNEQEKNNEKPLNNFNEIQSFVITTFPEYQSNFISDFLIATDYINNIVFLDYNKNDIQQEINEIHLKYEMKNFKNLQFNDFDTFLKNLEIYQNGLDSGVIINDPILQKTDINQFFKQIIEGCWIRKFESALKFQFEDKFEFINDNLETNDEISNQILKCEVSISILVSLKQFYEIQQENIKRMKMKFLSYQDSTKKQTQIVETDIYQRFINCLKKQEQNIITFQDQINKDLDFNIIKLKQNFKQIDSEIESDIQAIKIEHKNISKVNSENSQQEIIYDSEKQMNAQFLIQAQSLLHYFQVIFIIFFNQMNEIISISQDIRQKQNVLVVQEKQPNEIQYQDPKQELLEELRKLKINFSTFIQEVEQKISSKKDIEVESKHNVQGFGIDIFENQIIENQKIIKTIKRTKNYFQSYQKLLLIYLDIYNQKQNANTLYNFKEKIKNFHNLNRKYLVELKDSIEYQNNQQKNIDINLTLIQFLTFFEMEIHDDQNENEVGDEINIALIQEIKDYFNQKKNEVESLIEAKDYKVRECLVYNLIRLQNSNLENEIINFSSRRIQQIWVYEKDQRVRNLLKNKELIEMQRQIFSRDLQTMSDQIKEEIQQKIQDLENLQQQIRLQGNSSEREKLQLQLKQCYQQLDDSIENVSEMSDALNISLIFLKDILTDVKSIKTSIDNLQNNIQDIGNDIRKLRGKKFEELLVMRKQKILQQAQQQKVDSIYVQLQTIERNPLSGEEVAGSFLLKESIQDKDGEVNEFIWHQNLGTENAEDKDVMIISGYAGSGKSRSAKKIEEFIWKSQGAQSEWIPIYVSLPTLKNPKYNLLDQALETENYQFDKYQIQEFKDAIRKRAVKVVLILDSYDEMKSDCIQQNLIMTNKLIQDLNIEKKDRQVKIIITTRREILNSDGYEAWFYGESLQTLKEVLLLNFNQEQQDKYLEKYCKLSIKRTIRGIYEFVKSISGQTFDLVEFMKIWNSIINPVKQMLLNSKISDSDSIFIDEEEEIIIKKLKQQQLFQFLSDEQITGLRKDLLSLWSVKKFKKSIEIVNIQHLLTTPFMLEIIVQVLPTMTKKYQGSAKIKEIFKVNYLQLKKRAKISKKIRESLLQNQQNQIEQNSCSQGLKSLKTDQKIKRNVKKKKIDHNMDILESKQFFQNYSIDSKIDSFEGNIFLDGQNLYLNIIDADIIVMALKMKKFTAFEFYESFINFYHEQQIQKQRELGKISNYESFALDIYQFSSSLALDMTIRDLSQISYKYKGQLLLQSNYKATQDIDDWLDQYLSNSSSDNEYKKLIRSCILLSSKGSTYQYTHKSIQEFLVAQYIYNFIISLENCPQDQNHQFTDQELANLDRLKNSLFNSPSFNISNDAFRGACSMIKDVLHDTENINQKMIEIVQQSRNIQFSRAASNIIYLLSQMDIYLGSQKFDSIQLADTNISGLSFFESDLSRSKCKNVTINSCNFNQCNLSDIFWDDVICKEQPFLTGQESCYQTLSFSPDGKYLVSLGESGILKLWDPSNYKFLQDIAHDGSWLIKYVQFSSDSSFFLGCSENGFITKWDIPEFTQKQTQLSQNILKFELSQDCSKLYIKTDKKFKILQANQLFEDKMDTNIIWKYDSKIINYVMSPVDSILVISSSDNYITIVSTNNQVIKSLGSFDKNIYDMIFSQDGKQLAITYDSTIKIWDLQTNVCSEIQTDFSINCLNFTPDNKSLIIGGFHAISISDIEQLKVQKEIMKILCLEVCLSPTQNQIIALVTNKAIEIFNFETQESLNKREFDFQPKEINISQDGQKLALMFYEESRQQIELQILDFDTLKTIFTIPWNHQQWISYIFSKDFSRILINYRFDQYTSQTLELEIQVFKQLTEKAKLGSKISLKPQSQLIAYVQIETNAIILFNFEKDQAIGQELINNQKIVEYLCFSPIDNILAVGYEDSQLLIWDLNTFQSQQIKVEENLTYFQFFNYSPNGKLLIILSHQNCYIYETQNWKQIFELNDQYSVDKQIHFSFDSQFMAIINGDSILIWDIQNNFQKVELPKFQFNPNQMYFTPIKEILIFTEFENLIILNTSTNKIQQLNLKHQILCLSISSNGSKIAIALKDSNIYIVQLWNYINNQLEFIISEIINYKIDSLSFFNDDQQLFLKLQKENSCFVIIYSINQFMKKNILDQGFTCGTFSQNNELIALGRSQQIDIFTSQFKKCNYQLKDQSDITFVSFSNRNTLFISGNSKGEISFWNLQDQQLKKSHKISNYQIVNLKFIKDESILINLDQYQILNIVRVVDTEDNISLDICGYYEQINYFSTSPDGKMIIGINNQKNLIKLNEQNLKYGQFNYKEQIIKIFYSFSLEYLGVLQKQNLLNIISKNPQQCYQKKDIIDVTFHPKENLMAIYTNNQIQLIQIQDQKLLFFIDFSNDYFSSEKNLQNYQFEQQNIKKISLKFSDNGKILLFITDKIIRWYLLEGNKSLKVLGCNQNGKQFQNVNFFQSQYLAILKKKQHQKIKIKNIFEQNTLFKINCDLFSMNQEEVFYFQVCEQFYAFDFQKLNMNPITFKSDGYLSIEYIQAIDENQLILLNKKGIDRIIYLVNLVPSQNGQINGIFLQLEISKFDILLSHYFPQKKLWAVVFFQDPSTIQIWNIANKKIITNFQGHRQKINCLNSSYDGLVLATASEDNTIRLWNIDFFEQNDPSIGHKKQVNAIAFSKDGLLVASGSSDNTIILWDLYDKKFITQLKDNKGKINFLEFSYCSKLLYSGFDNMTIRIWDVLNPIQSKIIFLIDSLDYSCKSICLSPTNQNFFSINFIGKLCFFNKEVIQEKNYILNKNGSREKCCFIFINNNEFIYSSDEQKLSQQSLFVLNTINGKSTFLRKCKYESFFSIINSKSSKELIFLINFSENLRKIAIEGIESTKNQIDIDQAYLPMVQKIMLSPDLNTLVLETAIIISFWDFKLIKKEVLAYEVSANDFDRQSPQQLIIQNISSDSSYVITKSNNCGIKLYELNNVNNIENQNKNNFAGIIQYEDFQILALSFDIKYLAASYEKEDSIIYYWEVQHPEQQYQLNEENNANLITFEFCKINSYNIFAAYRNGNILIWNLQKKTSQLLINYDQTNLFQLKRCNLLFSNKFNYLFIIQEQSYYQEKNQLFNLKQKTEIKLNLNALMIGFSEDDKVIAYVDEYQLWLSNISNSNLEVIDQIPFFYKGYTFSIKFYQDFKLIIGQRYAIYVFDIKEKLKIIDYFSMPDEFIINGFRYNPNKQQITIFNKHNIKILNISNRIVGQPIKFYSKPEQQDGNKINILASKQVYGFSKDNQYFAFLNPNLSLWNAQTYELTRSYEYTGDLLAFQQCKSSLILAIASKQSLIFLDFSNLNDIKEIQNIKFEDSILSFSFSSKYCLTNHPENQIILHDIQNLREVIKSDIFIGSEGILSEDDQYLAYLKEDQSIKIIKTYKKKIYEVQNLSKLNKNSIDLISHSPCGQYLAIVQINETKKYPDSQEIISKSAQVQILNLNSLNLINEEKIYENYLFIEISENWKIMVQCQKFSIDIWEIKDQNQFYKKGEILQFVRKDWEDRSKNENDIYYGEPEIVKKYYSFLSISLLSTGDFLVSGNRCFETAENVIALWDVKIGKLIAQSGNLDSDVQVIKFCPDSTNFAAGFENGHLNLYFIRKSQNQDQEIQILCYKSIGRQSMIQAHQCIISEKSKIQKSKKSIQELFIQKGAIQKN
ncbi:unnamed protein product [Paramecium pentaurelia]|uniref:NACHT domain-containing protein n=1 Tax=Paramecium pentaurelia TaxID=43138 RepID=A0A8S1WU25_9CILI|nr:unnamed protein product [Paramecium pentaurelia]